MFNRLQSNFERIAKGTTISDMDLSNPVALVFALPIIVIAIAWAIVAFIRQPTADKVAQIALGCGYLILAIVLSPCACAIWIIQAIAS